MPIRPYLGGEFFDPELIETTGQALTDACSTLGLKDKEDAAVGLLARRIIKEAREGIHERMLLKAAALKGSDRRSRPRPPQLAITYSGTDRVG